MKKFITIVLWLVLPAVLINIIVWLGTMEYSGWKLIEIENCCTMKIPEEWIITEYNGRIYISDKELDEEDCTVFFVESFSYPQRDEVGIVESNLLSQEVQAIHSKKRVATGPGAIHGKAIYSIDGVEKEMLYVDIFPGDPNSRDVFLLAWDESIDEDLVIDMAKSCSYL